MAQRLRSLRLHAGIAARELDRLSGQAQGYAALIESGERKRVGAVIMTAYARTLGCTVEWLVSGLGQAPDKRRVVEAIARARESQVQQRT